MSSCERHNKPFRRNDGVNREEFVLDKPNQDTNFGRYLVENISFVLAHYDAREPTKITKSLSPGAAGL